MVTDKIKLNSILFNEKSVIDKEKQKDRHLKNSIDL